MFNISNRKVFSGISEFLGLISEAQAQALTLEGVSVEGRIHAILELERIRTAAIASSNRLVERIERLERNLAEDRG